MEGGRAWFEPMKQPWILIPVHNRRELTLTCLRHLACIGADRRFQTLVIDDGSDDGTSDAIHREFPVVRILAGDGQWWWTGAIARGMAVADREGAPAVVWLNDDCLPEAGALDALVAITSRSPATIAGATCATSLDHPGSEKFVTTGFTGRRAHRVPDTGQTEQAVDGLSGFCVAVPRPVWSAIGFPNASQFPHYYGDTAYTLRARQSGFPIILSGAARTVLAQYQERAGTVSTYLARRPTGARSWREVFVSPRSPFRAATQWHYLQLRYGRCIGTALTAARLARWQMQFIAAARG
jgi:GT2 family glycosyltransferase